MMEGDSSEGGRQGARPSVPAILTSTCCCQRHSRSGCLRTACSTLSPTWWTNWIFQPSPPTTRTRSVPTLALLRPDETQWTAVCRVPDLRRKTASSEAKMPVGFLDELST